MNPALPCVNCEQPLSGHTDEGLCLFRPGLYQPMDDAQLYEYIDRVASQVMNGRKDPSMVKMFVSMMGGAR